MTLFWCLMSFLCCLQAPDLNQTTPGKRTYHSYNSPSAHLIRPPLSALKTSSSFFLYLLLLIWHSLGLQYKHAPPTCLWRSGLPWPHADRRHTNTATVKSTDKTQSKALIDGRSGSRGQGCTHTPLFLCLVSQHCLPGRIHLCPCVVETLIGPHTTEHW